MLRTPLHTTILFAAYTGIRPVPYFDTETSRDFAEFLRAAGLIQFSDDPEIPWQVTDKGEAHVKAILNLPFPVAKWVTPKSETGNH